MALPAAALSVGYVAQRWAETIERERLAPSDPRHWVRLENGADIRIERQGPRTPRGEGEPLFVLVGGLGSSLEVFRFLQLELAKRVHTLAFDRAGTGFSTPAAGPATPRDARRIAGELRELLARIDAKPPYVLVGHSIGGVYSRVFAHDHPDLLRAVVLLDPMMEDDWPNATPAIREAEQRYFFRTTPINMVLSFVGIRRLGALLTGEPLASEAARAIDLRGEHWRGVTRESQAIFANFDEVRSSPLPPGLEVSVLSASLPAIRDISMVQGLHRQLAEAAGGVHEVLPNAEHNSMLGAEHAERVAQFILDNGLN